MFKSPSLTTIVTQPIKIGPLQQNDIEQYHTPKSSPNDLTKNTTLETNKPNNIFKSNELYEYLDLCKYLKLLSRVCENEKLVYDASTNSINIDSRYYFQGIRRWYSNDTRDYTLLFIEKIINSILFFLKTNNESHEQCLTLKKLLIISKVGIENLCITYKDDKNFTSVLAINIDQINTIVNNL